MEKRIEWKNAKPSLGTRTRDFIKACFGAQEKRGPEHVSRQDQSSLQAEIIPAMTTVEPNHTDIAPQIKQPISFENWLRMQGLYAKQLQGDFFSSPNEYTLSKAKVKGTLDGNKTLDHILQLDGFKNIGGVIKGTYNTFIQYPRKGDVIVYRDKSNNIICSGVVSKPHEDPEKILVKSKFGDYGIFEHAVTIPRTICGSDSPLSWEVYQKEPQTNNKHISRVKKLFRSIVKETFLMLTADTVTPKNGVYLTDKGTIIANWGDSFFGSTRRARLESDKHRIHQKFRNYQLHSRISKLADESYNCHSYTFTNGKAGWVQLANVNVVEQILRDNNFKKIGDIRGDLYTFNGQYPQRGDIIVYRDKNNEIIHSGVVSKPHEDPKKFLVKSKFGQLSLCEHAAIIPHEIYRSTRCEIYHTDRPQGRILTKADRHFLDLRRKSDDFQQELLEIERKSHNITKRLKDIIQADINSISQEFQRHYNQAVENNGEKFKRMDKALMNKLQMLHEELQRTSKILDIWHKVHEQYEYYVNTLKNVEEEIKTSQTEIGIQAHIHEVTYKLHIYKRYMEHCCQNVSNSLEKGDISNAYEWTKKLTYTENDCDKYLQRFQED